MCYISINVFNRFCKEVKRINFILLCELAFLKDIMHERDQEIVVQNGEIVDRKSEKKPLPEQEVQGNVSCLAYKQSDTPQFVYINDLSPTGHAFVPYNAYDRAPDVGEIPPKYEDINME